MYTILGSQDHRFSHLCADPAMKIKEEVKSATPPAETAAKVSDINELSPDEEQLIKSKNEAKSKKLKKKKIVLRPI